MPDVEVEVNIVIVITAKTITQYILGNTEELTILSQIKSQVCSSYADPIAVGRVRKYQPSLCIRS